MPRRLTILPGKRSITLQPLLPPAETFPAEPHDCFGALVARAWTTIGEAGPNQRTPNISAVIQEIVNRSGWALGNSLAVIVTGTGKRVAESFNGVANAAPLLVVEFLANNHSSGGE